uniref:Uncharacterized protein LOC111133512 isoform X2 n=1 Tax=Crassostrea virginica TaxID=6565 RepID=A0A8B8EAK9_CRAVI|nr:uncharacterized protein LOC111133512 isoform X2 [Crassostrea virginica]
MYDLTDKGSTRLTLQYWTLAVLSNGETCSVNESIWQQNSKQLCNVSNTYYHCLPSNYLNETVEICLKPQIIPKGHCAIYNTDQNNVSYDRASRCHGKNFTGCPAEHYYSNRTFLHPSCLQINPEHACYLAASGCPDIERHETTWSPGGGSSSDEGKVSPSIKLIHLFLCALVFCWLN